MELRQLQHFLAVIETGSFTQAAERLGLSQQAVSKSVQALENSLGVRLLHRTTRELSPTEQGLLLAGHARAVAGEMHEFEQSLRRQLGAQPGRLRLGASPTATIPVVTPAVREFLSRHPGVRLEIHNGLRRDLLPALAQGKLDLVVCLDVDDRHDAALHREVLCYDEYAVVAGPLHPLGRRCDTKTADLAEWPWILGRDMGDIEAAWDNVWRAAGLPTPEPAVATSSLEFCRAVLPGSSYLTILPRGLVAGEVASGKLQIIPVADLAWERPIALYYRPVIGGAAVVGALIESLRHAARAWQG